MLLQVVHALKKAGKDGRVRGLVGVLGGQPAGQMAQIQELRDAVLRFRCLQAAGLSSIWRCCPQPLQESDLLCLIRRGAASHPGPGGQEGSKTVHFLRAWALAISHTPAPCLLRPLSGSAERFPALTAGEMHVCPPWPLQRPLGNSAAMAPPATIWGEGATKFCWARS